MIKTPGSPEDSFAMQLANYEPTTIALASAGVGAATSVVSGFQQGAASDANAAIANQNATIADDNAVAAIEVGEQLVEKQEVDFQAFQSDNIVNYAKAGVTFDSPSVIEVLAANRTQSDIEKANIRYEAQLNANAQINAANQFRTEAQISKMQGKFARFNGIVGAGTSLLGGYGRYKSITTQNAFNKAIIDSQNKFQKTVIDNQNNYLSLLSKEGLI
tara:strand:- start:885 stop:1535 length:651 start_codon:yes stop_codon:yes gene_type:complete